MSQNVFRHTLLWGILQGVPEMDLRILVLFMFYKNGVWLCLFFLQINKASQNKNQMQDDNQMNESEDEDEDEVDDVLYGEEDDESQISSDNDD